MTAAVIGPPRRFSALRLAARLARRETRRRPGRTLLVTLLVAVPVAGMVVSVAWVRTDHQTAADRWRAEFGEADVAGTPGAPFLDRALPAGPGPAGFHPAGPGLADLLPEGTRVVSYRSEYRVLRTTGGERASVEVSDLPMADPMAAPIVQVTSGRAPQAAGEVFLTRAAARRLGAEPGDRLTLERPHRATWTVVGIGELRTWWDNTLAVLGPGTPFPWREGPAGTTTTSLLADLPDDVSPAELAALSRASDGVSFAPGLVPPGTPGATVADDGQSAEAVRWSWVMGALVLTVVGIVIAAAFAAGARRQLATLGQLAANGAAPSVLRKVLFLQGTWTGALGAVVGLGLGAVALAALAPHADRLLGRDVDPFTVRLADLGPVVALGIAAATVAALIPAWTTARVPVLAALAGRRPLAPVPRWVPATGAAVAGAGLALLGLAMVGANGASGNGTVWVLTAIVGGVAVLLGACAVSPAYVSVLEPLAARLRGPSRLAARSLARQRTRTGAVVSAVCATSALAIAASALLLSGDAQMDDPDWMRADEVQLDAHQQARVVDPVVAFHTVPVEVPETVVADVREAIPGAEAHRLAAAGVPGVPDGRWEVGDFVPARPSPDVGPFVGFHTGPFSWSAAIADDTLLGLYDLPAAARRALADEGAVAVAVDDLAGRATVRLVAEGSVSPPREVVPPFPVEVVAAGDTVLGSVPGLLFTPERAAALGLARVPGTVVVRAPAPLTEEQRTSVQAVIEDHDDLALDRVGPDGLMTSVNAHTLPPDFSLNTRLLEALLAAAAFLLSLFVVAVSLALAAVETRDERDVLAVVGAPPAAMRRTSGRKALLLTVLGGALAVPVGFLPVMVLIAASGDGPPLVFPWRVVLLLLVAVPAVSAAVTTVGSGLALRLRPVRVSTMAFD